MCFLISPWESVAGLVTNEKKKLFLYIMKAKSWSNSLLARTTIKLGGSVSKAFIVSYFKNTFHFFNFNECLKWIITFLGSLLFFLLYSLALFRHIISFLCNFYCYCKTIVQTIFNLYFFHLYFNCFSNSSESRAVGIMKPFSIWWCKFVPWKVHSLLLVCTVYRWL